MNAYRHFFLYEKNSQIYKILLIQMMRMEFLLLFVGVNIWRRVLVKKFRNSLVRLEVLCYLCMYGSERMNFRKQSLERNLK